MSFLFEKRFLSFASLLLSAAFLFAFLQNTVSPLSVPAVVDGNEKMVILDAGHGGMDAGAIGTNGMLEKDLNLSIVLLLAEHFKEAGVKVILTREDDELVLTEAEKRGTHKKEKDLANRLAVARANPGALFISIHMNAFSIPKYKGLEVYYAADSESEALAHRIMARVKREVAPDNTRTPKRAGDNIYLLSHAVTPAVLIECGFLSNPEEAAKLSDKDYQKQLSFCIFCAIMEMEN